MARYIKAVDCAEIISEKLSIPLGDLVDVFSEIPTADVVEVVRCKDCRYCYNNPNLNIYRCARFMAIISPEHFCSLGERKKDAT